MNRRIVTMVVLGVSLTLCGCLVVPTKEDTVLDGKPVTEEQLAFLTPKVTTQQEVVARLGNPNVIWEDQRIYAYNWVMRQGILFWALAGYTTAAVGAADLPKYHVFLIQFDEQERVIRFERVEQPWTQSYGDFLREWLAKTKDTQEPGR